MTRRILNSLKIGKIAAVDFPCQEGAQALIFKRGDAAKAPSGDASAETSSATFEDQRAQQNLWDGYGKAQSALQQSIESIVADDSVVDKAAMIGQSLDEFCAYIGQLVPSATTNTLAAGPTAATTAPAASAENPTTDTLKKALGLPATAADAELFTAIEALTKAAKDNERRAAMSDKHKAFMDNGGQMPEGGKDAFMAMSADERDAHIKGCGGAGDVAKMLTSGDAFEARDGTIVLKRKVGDEPFAILKAQNAEIAKQAAELAKRDEAEAAARFEKRATDLGFEPSFGATLRKAYGGDAAAQTKVEKRIAGLNRQIEEGALFMSFGKSGPKESSAESEFLAKVEAARKADPKLTHAQAYARIYKTRENADLVKRMTAEQHGAN